MKASNSTMMTGNKKTKKTKLGDDEDATKLDAKKKKKNLEPVEVPDQFDPEVLLDIKVDICVMCKGNHEVGLRLKEKIIVRSAEEEDPDEIKAVDPDSILDVNGVWASKYSILRKSQRMFVHYYCALNSPQAIFCGNRWSNLTKEVARGRSLICRYCGQGGATLGCLDNRCHVVMHVPCAVKLGFRRSGFKLSFLCEDHTKSYLEKELALDDQVRNDLSKGREPVPVTSVNHLDTALASKQVEYTKVNLDSTDVAMNVQSVHDMDCCQCDGLCDDVAQCACLSLGRNYTFTGGLIPGAKKKVLECNLRCGCSIRRCTNRVVEKGPTYRLEVFRVSEASTNNSKTSGSSAGASSSNNKPKKKYAWGVRTLDFIPENAFVCEVTGQYAYGRSVVAHVQGDVATSTSSKDSSGAPSTLTELILADPASASSSGTHLSYATKVVPVRAWLEGDHTNKEISDPLVPALWAAEQERAKQLLHAQQAQQAQIALQARRTQEEGEWTMDTTESVLPVLPVPVVLKEFSTQSVREILDSERHAVRCFLDGELCIDSRQFGNVGSFIRRRPIGSNSHTQPNEVTYSSSVSAPVVSQDSGRMLHRRIVYTNKNNPNGAPKLALFAARNIEANTELLI